MKLSRIQRGAAVLITVAGLVACSSGAGSLISGSNGSSGNGTQQGQKGSLVHRDSLVGSAQGVTGAMIQPLTLTVSNNVGTVALYGTALCGAASGGNPCPGTTFTSATWSSTTASTPTIGSSTLNAACAAPAGSPSPAPGFTPGCYIVAYEAGAGPYLIQGPATVSGSSLSFAASSTPISLDPNLGYNFFLAYVTSIAPVPTPTPIPPPSPSPIPTEFQTPIPPTATPAPALGACGRFAVLATNAQWANVHFQPNALAQGDVGVNGAGLFHAEQDAIINGTVLVVPGTQIEDKHANISGGVVVDQATVAAAVASEEALNAAEGALAPTIPMNAINLGQGQSATITGASGTNVLSLSSLEMGQDTTLTLNAPAGSNFVINISGEARIGNTARILLAGGINSANVVLNFTGTDGQVLVQYSSLVNGTILAPYRTNVHIDHTTVVNGAVIGDGQVMEFAYDSAVGTCNGGSSDDGRGRHAH